MKPQEKMKKDNYTPKESKHNRQHCVDEQEKNLQDFLDVQENLDQYSDEELEELFVDKELQDALNSTALLKQELKSEEINEHQTHNCDFDINAEWKHFKQTYLNEDISSKEVSHAQTCREILISSSHQWRKIAAAFISIVMISGLTFAAILWQQHHKNQQDTESITSTKKNQVAADTVNIQNTSESKKDSTIISSTPILFDNTELGIILEEMGKHYGKQVMFKSKAEHLRLRFEWNQQLSLQQNLQILNGFQHINISLENDKIIVE